MGFFSRLFGGSSNEGPEPADLPQPAKEAAPADLPKPDPVASKEAAQLARLLISELVLYNEEALETARQRGNVYAALKDDIDRIRRMYDKSVDRRKVDRDYFYLEMVARLARGNPEFLGVPPPDAADRSAESKS